MLFVALLVVASLAVVFRLGNQASAAVALNDPVVWVEDGARGRILQINGSTKEITASVRVGESGDSLVTIPRGRDAVFLNRTTGELGVIGAVSLDIDSVEELVGSGAPLQGEQLEIMADLRVSTDAYILDTDRVLVFEPGAGDRLDIPTPDGLGDRVVDADGRLVAVTFDARRLGVTADRGLVPLVDLPPPIGTEAQPPGLARAGNDLYVVDSDRRTVNRVAAEGELGPTMCVAGSLSDVQIAGNVLTNSDGDRRVLVHDPAAGILSVTEVERSDCFQIDIGERGDQWGDPVAVDSVAYLPNFESGRIVIVDLEERVVLNSVSFSSTPGREFELEVFDGAVWANEPQGSRAAIIAPDGIERISKLRAVIVTSDPDASGEGFGGIIPGEGESDRVFGTNDGQVPGGPGEVDEEPEATDPNSSGGGGDEPGTDDLDPNEAPVNPQNSPIVIDPIESQPSDGDELVANFSFSAQTVNAGEAVEFTDESTGNPTSWNWDFGDGTGSEGPEAIKIWETEGVYTVTLFVANARGDEAEQSLEVTVVADDVLRVPTADFSFRSDTVEVGETIEFVDESTGEPESLLWSFGDGEVASGSVVTHVFEEPGSFEVSLTAGNAAGSNTTSAIITVVDGVKPPQAIIGGFPRVVEVGQSVTLTSESTNSPTAISWRFDDGDSALGTTVRHAWRSAGTFRIRLSVSNSAGADEAFADILVEPGVSPPTARFGQSALEAVVGETISFNDLSLNSPTSLTWEFGDGATAQGANVSHSWDDDGSYTVTLTARNDAGSDDVSKTVTVIPLPPNPPSAGFTVASATVPVNSVVKFVNTTTGDATEWAWDFGDGTSSVAKSPPHGYSSPGTYEVTLVASNAGGSDSVTKTIVVVDPPIAAFTRTVDELVASFTDITSNDPTSWEWDFGDGTASAAQNPVKTYDDAGTYTVTLIASNEAGISTPFTATVQVARQPGAAFTVVTGGLTAEFTDASTRGPTAWLWDLGDGTTSAVQNPKHAYATAGTYDVTLTVSNVAGSSSQSQSVTVDFEPPVADFTCTPVGGGVACDGSTSIGEVSYAWVAADAILITGQGTATPTFTFATSGTYSIRLTVENASGTPDSTERNVTVTVPQPPGAPVVTVVSNVNGLVQLTATASNSPTGWSWSASGGTPSTGSNSSFTTSYTTDGDKTIRVFATNAVGAGPSTSTIIRVNVSTPPVVTNVAVSSEGPPGTVTLTGSATNSPTSWSWSIAGSTGAGSTSNPTVSFTSNGTYTGSVRATNGAGTSAQFPVSITISGLP